MSIVVYGLPSAQCRYCKDAKDVLNQRGIPFRFVDISQSVEFVEFFKTKHKTVPQIYVDGEHVGDSSKAHTVGVEDNEEFTF